MDDTDRKLLEALSFKDKVSIAGLADQMLISGELIESRLPHLFKKDLVRMEWPIHNPKFLYITEKGRRALWSWKRTAMDYIGAHHLILIGLIISLLGNVIALAGYYLMQGQGEPPQQEIHDLKG